VSYELPETPMGELNDTARAIARHIAGIIPNGATLQMGIGGIPDAVLHELHSHKHLGIHTELFSDGIIDLVDRGIIDGEMKSLHRGRSSRGSCSGRSASTGSCTTTPLWRCTRPSTSTTRL